MKLNMKRSLVYLLVLTLMSSVMPFAFAEEQQKWEVKSKPTYEYRSDNYANFNYSAVYKNNLYLFGGTSSPNKDFYRTEMYDPTSNRWYEKASMPDLKETGFKFAVIDDKCYIILSQKIISYTFETDKWEDESELPDRKGSPKNCEEVNGKLYIIRDNGTMFEYNPQTKTVSAKANMPTVRSDYEIQNINGKLYVLGGISKDTTNTVEMFDPETNMWTTKSSMLFSRRSFQTEVVNNKIYAIGGRGEDSAAINSVEMYDPLSDTWNLQSSMVDKRYYFRTSSTHDKIYALGGYIGSTSLATVEEYDVTKNEWKSLSTMNISRVMQIQLQTIANSLFVIGGAGSNFMMESYKIDTVSPTLTVTAVPNKVKVGNRFTTTVAIHNVSNIYAEDIKIDYDAERFEYVGASAKDELKIYKEDTSTPGSVRFIVAHLGKDNGATGDKDLIELTFKAKSVGIGKVDITKGRIADNDVLEMDVAEENCGEDTIEVEANKDVNRTGEYTLLDLGIDAYYYGLPADQTDTTRFDTDVIPDGVIDDKDLTAITQSILDNSNYPFN